MLKLKLEVKTTTTKRGKIITIHEQFKRILILQSHIVQLLGLPDNKHIHYCHYFLPSNFLLKGTFNSTKCSRAEEILSPQTVNTEEFSLLL